MAKKRALDDPFAASTPKEGLLPSSEKKSSKSTKKSSTKSTKKSTKKASTKSSKKGKMEDPFAQLLQKEGLLPTNDAAATPTFDANTLLSPLTEQISALKQHIEQRIDALQSNLTALQQEVVSIAEPGTSESAGDQELTKSVAGLQTKLDDIATGLAQPHDDDRMQEIQNKLDALANAFDTTQQGDVRGLQTSLEAMQAAIESGQQSGDTDAIDALASKLDAIESAIENINTAGDTSDASNASNASDAIAALQSLLETRLGAIEEALEAEGVEGDEGGESTKDAADEALAMLLGRLDAIEENIQGLRDDKADEDEAPDYTQALDQLYAQVQQLVSNQDDAIAAAAEEEDEEPWHLSFQTQLRELTQSISPDETLRSLKRLQARLDGIEEQLEQAPATLANVDGDVGELQLSEDDRAALATIQRQIKALNTRLDDKTDGNDNNNVAIDKIDALDSKVDDLLAQLGSQEAPAENADLGPLEAQLDALQQQIVAVSEAQESAIEAQSQHLASQLMRWQETLPAQIAALVPVGDSRPSLLGGSDLAMPDGLLPNFAEAPALIQANPTPQAVNPAAPAPFNQEALYHTDRHAYSRNFAAVIGTVLVVVFLCGLALWLPSKSKWASAILIMGQLMLTMSGIFSLRWLAREREQIERRIADHERKLKREHQLGTTLEPFPAVLNYALMGTLGLWWIALFFIR